LDFLKPYKSILLPIIGSTLLYLLFAYTLERSDFLNLLLLYSGLFYCAWQIINVAVFNFWALAVIGVLFRLIFLPAIPNLSQDFYRFLWDGQVLVQGVTPYLFTPEQFMEASGLGFDSTRLTMKNSSELVTGMGELNASHYSNYPPINQLCFVIAALFAKGSILGSVIILRVLIIAAEYFLVFLKSVYHY
jgi:alpha-1,6-mannosyltransferase